MNAISVDSLIKNYRLVTNNGTVLINGNNIVLQHQTTNEIGYLENTPDNRRIFNLPENIICIDEGETDMAEDREEAEFNNHDEHWTEPETKKLIALYMENVERFKNPKIKKKEIWRDIAGNFEMKSAESCDKKFRNLKQHYIYISKKKKQTGRGATTWPFFHILRTVFENDSNINPEREINIIETLDIENSNPNIPFNNGEVQSQTIETPSNSNSRPRKRKRNEDLKKLLVQSEERQVNLEKKIDKLLDLIGDSNSIQSERNKLLEKIVNKRSD